MSAPHPSDLLSLDRDVARAFAAWGKWQLALATDAEAHADDAPLDRVRHVAAKSTYDGLAGGSAAEAAHREALRRWVYALMQARIAQPLDVEWAKAVAEESALLSLPKPHHVSWRDAWASLLRTESRAERSALLDAAASRGPALAAIAKRRRERREEAANRMGFEGADPSFPVADGELAALAEAILARTDDLAREVFAHARRRAELPADPPLAIDAIAIGVARDAPEGWPASLSVRWLESMFGEMARGLKLAKLTLPDAVGGSSFARACAAFGAALRVAGVAASVPFAMARDPEPVGAHRFACVFGALPASPAFQRRVLGNVARVADAQARVLARTSLLHARLEASRFLLRAAKADVFEELTHRLFGAPLPHALAGAWPTPALDARARLVGLATAAPLTRELVDRFDVDWFANPRATVHVRALASAPAWEGTPPDLATAVAGLARAFEEALA